MDLTLRLPRFLQDRELEIRNLVSKSLVRGKINLSFDFTRVRVAGTQTGIVNQAALAAAYQELSELSARTGASLELLTALAKALPGSLRLPPEGTLLPEQEDEVSWEELLPLVQESLDRVQEFRRTEGQALTVEILGSSTAFGFN